jgi:hypothetical protein
MTRTTAPRRPMALLAALVALAQAPGAQGADTAGAAPADAASPASASPAGAPTPSASAPAPALDGAATFVAFVLETTSNCLLNNGQQVQMRSNHPSRKVRVWLDRFQRGIGTGDRSRTDLVPGADPEPLGCSRSAAGVQEWRIVRAVFID